MSATYHQEHRLRKGQPVFDISQKLMLNQSGEIYGISSIDWNTIPWMRTTLLHDRAVKLAKAKVHVFSDSVLCLGRNHEIPMIKGSLERANRVVHEVPMNIVNQIVLAENQSCSRWTIFPGHSTLQLLREIQPTMVENRIQPEQFEDRTIFMPMYCGVRLRKSRCTGSSVG